MAFSDSAHAQDENQTSDVPLMLLQQSKRFSFFQAMREIETSFAQSPRVGCANSPMLEAFQIHQPAELTFAPTTVEATKNCDGKIQIEQRFFGLLGPSGPLPLHVTEIVRNRARHAGDEALQAFLDLFHHRMASIFYRAWSSARPTVQRDRPNEDRFRAYLGSLSGVGLRTCERRDAWSEESKSYFAGHMGSSRRNVEGLTAVLKSVCNTPVVVQPFALRWLSLTATEVTKLGGNRSSGVPQRSAPNCLGRTAVIGQRVPDRQSLVEVRLGPMSYAEYEQLLPVSVRSAQLQAVMRSYAGPSIDACVRPVLRKDEVPMLKLGEVGQLGRSAWLHSAPATCDRSDYCFETSQSAVQGSSK